MGDLERAMRMAVIAISDSTRPLLVVSSSSTQASTALLALTSVAPGTLVDCGTTMEVHCDGRGRVAVAAWSRWSVDRIRGIDFGCVLQFGPVERSLSAAARCQLLRGPWIDWPIW